MFERYVLVVLAFCFLSAGLRAESFSGTDSVVRALSDTQSVADARAVLTRFVGPTLSESQRDQIAKESDLPMSQFLFSLRKKQILSLPPHAAAAILLHSGFQMSELNAFYETHDEYLKQSFRKTLLGVALLQGPLTVVSALVYSMSNRYTLLEIAATYTMFSVLLLPQTLLVFRSKSVIGAFGFDTLEGAAHWSKLASARESKAFIGSVPLRCFEALIRAGSTRE